MNYVTVCTAAGIGTTGPVIQDAGWGNVRLRSRLFASAKRFHLLLPY